MSRSCTATTGSTTRCSIPPSRACWPCSTGNCPPSATRWRTSATTAGAATFRPRWAAGRGGRIWPHSASLMKTATSAATASAPAAARPRRCAPTGISTSPTTCFASRPSCKALPSWWRMALRRTPRPKPRARLHGRWRNWPGRSRSAVDGVEKNRQTKAAPGRRFFCWRHHGFRILPQDQGTAGPTAALHGRAHLPGRDRPQHPTNPQSPPKTKELQARLRRFMDEHISPAETAYSAELAANTAAGKRWSALATIENLKPKARAAGLWNLFLPVDSAAASGYDGAGLTNQEYAPLAEIMGRVPWASEVFNCSAPDTGNMETIARYGDEANKARWLVPLLEGRIRSAFAMTEPEVASSDATNIATRIERQGDEDVNNGHKWWISGAADPRCAVFVTMGKTDPEAPRHSQQSMVLVPADSQGITIVRPLNVMGYDDAPHGHVEMTFENVRVPVSSILLGEGRGFEIPPGRLGPGRIHHC